MPNKLSVGSYSPQIVKYNEGFRENLKKRNTRFELNDDTNMKDRARTVSFGKSFQLAIKETIF